MIFIGRQVVLFKLRSEAQELWMEGDLGLSLLEGPISFLNDHWPEVISVSILGLEGLPVLEEELANGADALGPLVTALLLHQVHNPQFLLQTIPTVQLDQPRQQQPPVQIFKQILLLHQFKDQNGTVDDLLCLLATAQVSIQQQVESEGNVEFLIVDPLLEGKDCTIVYLELPLCFLKQSSDLMVEVAEGGEERCVFSDGKCIESCLDPAHEPCDVSLHLFVPSQTKQLQNGQGKLLEELLLVDLVHTGFVSKDDHRIYGTLDAIQPLLTLLPYQNCSSELKFLLQLALAPHQVLDQVVLLPFLASSHLIVLPEERFVVPQKVSFEKLLLLIQFSHEVQQSNAFRSVPISACKDTAGGNGQGLGLSVKRLQQAIPKSFSERQGQFLLAVVDIKEETDLCHLANYCSSILQDLEESSCSAIRRQFLVLPVEVCCQLLFKEGQEVGLAMVLGELIDDIVGHLVPDLPASPSYDQIQLLAQLLHQLLRLP